MSAPNASAVELVPLTTAGRYVILFCAFFGWLCAGFLMAITSIAMQPAAIDLLGRTGSIDVPRYQELSQLAGKGSPAKVAKRELSEPEKAQLEVWKTAIGQWWAYLQCAFLFGGAAGGLFFGRIGDRFGRSKAMAFSILTYSLMSAAVAWAQSPPQLVVIWFVACTGVGGMWPNGVALVAEAWSNWSRPMAAGVIGTAANIGIFVLSSVAAKKDYAVTPADWNWILGFGAAPVVLGVFSLFAVPESPRWLAAQGTEAKRTKWARPTAAGAIVTLGIIASFVLTNVATKSADTPANRNWLMWWVVAPVGFGFLCLLTVPELHRWLSARRQREVQAVAPPSSSTLEVFRPPLRSLTLIAIVLATIPIFGAWGSANWMVSWAADAGDMASPPNPLLKANVQQCRSITGLVSSLFGGWIATRLGRRKTYFLSSLGALIAAQYTFWFMSPTDPGFLVGVAALGFFSGIFFGWMPLCLPELFPTKLRSTGAGVGFNFGRIITACTVFATGSLIALFGDYAHIGRVTSLVFVLGMIFIWFVPDTGRSELKD